MNKIFTFLLLLSICVSCGMPTEDTDPNLVIMPYPNPATNQIRIEITNNNRSAFSLLVFDPNATLISELHVEEGNRTYNVIVDIMNRAKGSYQVVLKKDSQTYTSKFYKI